MTNVVVADRLFKLGGARKLLRGAGTAQPAQVSRAGGRAADVLVRRWRARISGAAPTHAGMRAGESARSFAGAALPDRVRRRHERETASIRGDEAEARRVELEAPGAVQCAEVARLQRIGPVAADERALEPVEAKLVAGPQLVRRAVAVAEAPAAGARPAGSTGQRRPRLRGESDRRSAPRARMSALRSLSRSRSCGRRREVLAPEARELPRAAELRAERGFRGLSRARRGGRVALGPSARLGAREATDEEDAGQGKAAPAAAEAHHWHEIVLGREPVER